MRRKRRHIGSRQKLASALACLLPAEQRDELRSRHAPLDEILGLFHWDHIVLFAHDGADTWDNLTPMLVTPHRQKSRRDTSIVAKVKRLRQAPQAVAGKPKPNTGSSVRVDAKRTMGAPRRPWGITGMRKKINGEVVRR